MQQSESISLTEPEANVMRWMQEHKGSFLVYHRKMTGTEVYRCLDAKRNPLNNFSQSVITKLINLGLLVKIDNQINLTSKGKEWKAQIPTQ